MIWQWFLHYTGANNESGAWYGFWSGFGSDVGEITLVGALVGVYRKNACHELRCWRLGHHPVQGTPYKACRRHHPGLPDKPRRGEIARAWHAARKQRVTNSTGGPDGQADTA